MDAVSQGSKLIFRDTIYHLVILHVLQIGFFMSLRQRIIITFVDSVEKKKTLKLEF